MISNLDLSSNSVLILLLLFFNLHQILLWELGKAVHLFPQNKELDNLSTDLLFGFSPSVSFEILPLIISLLTMLMNEY